MTTVVDVHVKSLRAQGVANLEAWLADDNNVYIGRRNFYVKGTFDSKWRNPYSVKKYGRQKCLEMYAAYISEHATLSKDVAELRNKNLGCWCAPQACHGDILRKLADQLNK